MRNRNGNKNTIGDIIAGLISRHSPPVIAKQRSLSQRVSIQDSLAKRQSRLEGDLASEAQGRQTGSAFSPASKNDLRNWLAATTHANSRLLEALPTNRPTPFRKYASIREPLAQNPERLDRKWVAWETGESWRRHSSRMQPRDEPPKSKFTARVADSFKQFQPQPHMPAKTSCSFYPPSTCKQDLKLKVNSTFVTLPGRSSQRGGWQRRRSPFLTFYK